MSRMPALPLLLFFPYRGTKASNLADFYKHLNPQIWAADLARLKERKYMLSWYRVFVAAIGFLCSLFSLLLAVSMIVLIVSPADAQTFSALEPGAFIVIRFSPFVISDLASRLMKSDLRRSIKDHHRNRSLKSSYLIAQHGQCAGASTPLCLPIHNPVSRFNPAAQRSTRV